MLSFCKICGNPFNASSRNNTLCSQECKAISKKENCKKSIQKRAQLERVKGTGNDKKIIDINAEAKAMGMSYGRYVAYMSMKEGK